MSLLALFLCFPALPCEPYQPFPVAGSGIPTPTGEWVHPTAHFGWCISPEESWRRWRSLCKTVRWLETNAYRYRDFPKEAEAHAELLAHCKYLRSVFDALADTQPYLKDQRHDRDWIEYRARRLKELIGAEAFYEGRLPHVPLEVGND